MCVYCTYYLHYPRITLMGNRMGCAIKPKTVTHLTDFVTWVTECVRVTLCDSSFLKCTLVYMGYLALTITNSVNDDYYREGRLQT